MPNAIWITKAKRQQVGLPDELVILFDNNGAEYYCLDTSEPETSRVVIWDTRSRKVRAVKAESLFEFVVNELAEVI